MRAVYITQHGGPEVLTLGDLPEPSPGPNDLKVRVRACSINRLDLYVRAGARGTHINFSGPHVLGGDVAGEVVETGSEVVGLASGDRIVVNPRLICGQCRFCSAGREEFCLTAGMLGSTVGGGYAEYVSVPAANAVHLPDSISYVQGASLPTVFLPCWNIFMRRAALKAWETTLVLSASSGVGTAAIQVAKRVVGATVIATTSSADKALRALALGVDHVIDYTREDVADRVKELTDGQGVDVVLDHVGSDFWPAAIASLAAGGRYGICGVTSGYKAELQMGTLFLKNQTVFGAFMGRTSDLREIVHMVDMGVVAGVIDGIFPLEEAARAHERIESRSVFGKLVLTVD